MLKACFIQDFSWSNHPGSFQIWTCLQGTSYLNLVWTTVTLKNTFKNLPQDFSYDTVDTVLIVLKMFPFFTEENWQFSTSARSISLQQTTKTCSKKTHYADVAQPNPYFMTTRISRIDMLNTLESWLSPSKIPALFFLREAMQTLIQLCQQNSWQSTCILKAWDTYQLEIQLHTRHHIQL